MVLAHIQRVIRIVLIIISVATFFWLLAKDFVVTGVLEATYDFSHETAFIRQLRLPAQLDPIAYDRATGDYTQTMREDRVTFDAYLSRRFDRAIVELKYQKDLSQELRLGVQKRIGRWDPRYAPLVEVQHDGVWTIARATIDHLESIDFSKQRYQFVLFAPDLMREKPGVTLTSIHIRFEREPWRLNNFFPRLWKFVTKK